MNPDSKVNGTNMGPTWVLSAPDEPHVGPMNLVIREVLLFHQPQIKKTGCTETWKPIHGLAQDCDLAGPLAMHC